MNIIGNKKTLFSMHGVIDSDKCLNALEKLSNENDFDINSLNNISETGGLYVKANGTILDGFSKLDEQAARYKLVPTGLKFRYSEYPLFAGFIKLQGAWEGCFVGTGTQLFEMYKDHYAGNFDYTYLSVFGGENRVRDIFGFGLTEVLEKDIKLINDDVVYSSGADCTESISTQLEAALNKLNAKMKINETSSNRRGNCKHKNKAQRKAEKLQKHLARVKEKEEKQRLREEELKKELEEQERIKDELARTENGIVWTTVSEIEDAHFKFIDAETKAFNDRINEYINSSDCIEQFKKEDATCSYIDEGIKKDKISDDVDTVVENVENTSKECNVDNTDTVDCNCVEEADEQSIMNYLDHDDDVVKTESERYRMQIKKDIINDIYERLLIKENWKFNNKQRLGFYLRGICLYAWREQQENPDIIRGNGYTFSVDKKYCVLNTGLIDVYGNFIYLIDHSPSIPDFYTKIVSIMYNKAALLNMGFDINNVKYLPMPINFIRDKSELIFDAKYEDFDLDDTAHLFHIITERIGRFPDKYSNESPLYLCERIKTAIRQAIMISKTDYKYVIPKYDFSRRAIQFLIPLYLDNSPEDAPELTVVVGKQTNGMWSIFTVLYSDDAYDDARLICRANDSWLNMKKRGGI